jgi:hypothetical protein
MYKFIARSPSASMSFLQFTWKDQVNRGYLLLGIGISIVSFIAFKLLYPYPDFFSDSYSYIFAASANLNISIWPIGYSKFLSVFHALTHSDTVLVAFQYFFIQFSALYLYFTVLYFFNTSKWTENVLFIFLFVNPLTLYLANTINSDALFGSLSLIWITGLIWIIQRPRTSQLFTQAILLFLCFSIRNNAYYYPLVAAITFLLSKQMLWRKIVGILLPFVLLLPFIMFTQNASYKLTGTKQFSLFTGWQLANNALYIYDQINVDSITLPTKEAKELNRISIEFFKHIKTDIYRDYLESYVGNFFIRQPEAPLKEYYRRHYTAKDELSNVITWAKASAAFEPFGKSILVHHPIAYIRYFVYPNSWHYFVPPLSHLEQYNYGENTIDPIGQHWFDYREPKIHVFSYSFQGTLLMIYQAFFLLINLYYLWYLIGFIARKGFIVKGLDHLSVHKLIAGYFLLNLGFSLIATTNILRYQFVPMIVILAFALILSDVLSMQLSNKTSSINSKKKTLSSSNNPIIFEKNKI